MRLAHWVRRLWPGRAPGASSPSGPLGELAADPARREGLRRIAALGTAGAFAALDGDTCANPLRIAAAPLPPAGGRVDIRRFGARGDRRTDDFAAIARAIAATKRDQYPASLFIPTGHYRRSATLAVPSHSCWFGEGLSSILNSQNDAFDAPILTNADPYGLIAAWFQDLSLYGGSHGLRLEAAAENANIRLLNVSMLLQTKANIEANRLFQTAKLVNCVFGDAEYGLRLEGAGTNCLIALGTEWLGHQRSAIKLRGADGVTVIGSRFEHGGTAGNACIDIERASNILFIGCFFEDVHEYLGRFRNIYGSVMFQSCHFTGTKLGGSSLKPFRWDTADSMLVFQDCVSVVPMPVGGHVMLIGANTGISATGALYQGSEQAGALSTAVPVRGDAPLLLATFTATGAWQLHARLTLLRQSRAARVVECILSDAGSWSAPDPALKIDLVPSRSNQTTLIVAPSPELGDLAHCRLEWTLTGGAPPLIRAVLPK